MKNKNFILAIFVIEPYRKNYTIHLNIEKIGLTKATYRSLDGLYTIKTVQPMWTLANSRCLSHNFYVHTH